MRKKKQSYLSGFQANEKPFRFLGNFIFFLNLFIALLIITGSWVLVRTEFGQSAMILGFLMLCISVLLKAVRWW